MKKRPGMAHFLKRNDKTIIKWHLLRSQIQNYFLKCTLGYINYSEQWLIQRILTYFVRSSMTVQLYSCYLCLCFIITNNNTCIVKQESGCTVIFPFDYLDPWPNVSYVAEYLCRVKFWRLYRMVTIW